MPSTWTIAGIILLASWTALGIQTVRLSHSEAEKATLQATYAQRDAEAQKKATDALKAAEDRARAAEQKSAQDIADISAKFEQEKANVALQTRKTIADLHTGNLSLRVALDTARSATGDPSSAAQAGSGSSGCNGGQTAGFLAEPDAAFLISEAGRADEVVKQLGAAQAVILKDREICK